jgi:hypothetical protein
MLVAKKAHPTGFGLDIISFFNASFTFSCAWSLLPSPPHRPVWHCHAKIMFAREPR